MKSYIMWQNVLLNIFLKNAAYPKIIQNQYDRMSDPPSWTRTVLSVFISQLIHFVKDVFGFLLSSCHAEAVSQDTE